MFPLIVWCQSPGIYHRAPLELLEDTPFVVEVIAEPDFTKPENIRVYYRVPDSPHYNEIKAVGTGYAYRAVIPVDAVTGDTLNYFIIGDYGSEGLVGLPATNPKQSPYAIPIRRLQAVIRSADSLEIRQPTQVTGTLSFLSAPSVKIQQRVTVWRVISTRYSPAENPTYHTDLPGGAVECGMIRVEGNRYAGYVELYAALRHLAKQQRADGFTQLRYETFTRGVGDFTDASLPVMEAVYFSSGPTHQY